MQHCAKNQCLSCVSVFSVMRCVLCVQSADESESELRLA